MASDWAYEIAREQRRDVETMATNLDAARAQGRREGLEEAIVAVEKYEQPLSPSHWVFGSSRYGKGYTCGRTTGKTVAIDAIRARM